MNRRVLGWGTALTVVGALILVLALHAILTFAPRADDTQQVLTLGQLMAVLAGSALAIIGLVVLGRAVRHQRRRRRSAVRDRRPGSR